MAFRPGCVLRSFSNYVHVLVQKLCFSLLSEGCGAGISDFEFLTSAAIMQPSSPMFGLNAFKFGLLIIVSACFACLRLS
jgi:hypothetical protein